MLIISLSGAAALAGCMVGPDYQRPDVATPDRFVTPAAAQPTGDVLTTAPTRPTTTPAADITRWWKSFNDPELNSLLGRAYQSNLDLKVAQSRLVESRAQRNISAAGLYPKLDATGSYTREQTSGNGSFFGPTGARGGSASGSGGSGAGGAGTGGAGGAGSGGASIPAFPANGIVRRFNLFQAGFDASWELDVFGGQRRGVEAADADSAAAVEDRRATLISVLGEVARNYVQYRGLQRQIAITRDNLKSDTDTLALTRTRFDRGLTTYLDVARAEAQLQSTAAQLPAQDTSLKQALFQLGVLLGQEPAALSQELAADAPIPVVTSEIPAGLPSEMLRRRPDVRRAERQLAAANARIGVAVAELYPKFSLTGQLGQQSVTLKRFADAGSTFWSFGPSLSWNLFDAGRNRSNIDVYKAREQQSLAQYRQQVLTSLQDVDNALTAYANERARHEALTRAVFSSREAYNLATDRYTNGLTDFLVALDAQRSLFIAQDQLAQSDTAIGTSLVAVYKALGGGWEWETDQGIAFNDD